MATLNARIRESGGKGLARKLRRSGEIPAIAYGHGRDAQSLSVNAHELQVLLSKINPENTLIELNVENAKPSMALIREIQQHPSRPFIQHIDFFMVKAGEKLHVAVPVRILGSPIGVRENGGILQESMHELTVECLPKDIPTAVEVDVENLDLGQSIHVSAVSVANGTILNDPELVICSVILPSVQAVEEVDDEEESEEPEVIAEPAEEE